MVYQKKHIKIKEAAMKEKLQQFITLTVNRREYEIPVGNNRGDMPQSETLAHTCLLYTSPSPRD